MNISLTTELDSFVQEKVESGLYHSASEVIRAGLRLLKEQDALREVRLEQLRKDINLGIEQIERGDYTDHADDELPALADTIKAEGRRRRAARITP